MKRIISLALLAAASMHAGAQEAAQGTKVTYDVRLTRGSEKALAETTRFMVNTDVLCETFGHTSLITLNKAIASKAIKFLAIQQSTGKTMSSSTYGTTGFWFKDNGDVVNSTSPNRRVGCQYDDGFFKVTHYASKANIGDEYRFSEMFVAGTDTVQYNFHVTITNADNILGTTQPAFEGLIKGRPDNVDAWKVKPLVAINDQPAMPQNYIQVMEGDRITLDCAVPEGSTPGKFTWKNRKGKSLQTSKPTSAWVIENAAPSDAGYYVLSGNYYNEEGKLRTFKNCMYYVDVQTQPLGTPFLWEGHVPQFSHDWSTDAKYNNGVYKKPEMLLGDVPATDRNGKPTQWVEGDWWAVCWGSDLNEEAGRYDGAEVRKCAENMVKKYDEDFAYIRDYMKWPPDLRARNGYKSLIYIFGSGLQKDNTPNTEKGGYQGAIWYSDPKTGISANWPCVWASYLPFSRFRDDADSKWSDGEYQREAMIHEGIHAIFADLEACRKSAWFHEAGNTWLQSAMNTERYNQYGTPGFLDACPFIAPFMPIECYSGWLQDGSFGGPTAEGVNMFNSNGQQICTWRNLLGGTQYGNAFPIILGEIAGKGAIPWIWRNCTDYVLKGIGNYLGEETMRQLILQYRSRMALFDIGGWRNGYRDVTNGNFGTEVRSEWSPYWINVEPFKLTMYQGLTKNSADGWMAPDTLTNPGWSGANIIPIHVDSQAGSATVEFRPENEEMRAQLCYTTADGNCHYSQPAHCGLMRIELTERPANEVIFCVVANTDYIYTNDNNEAQRKKHWDYRIRLREGALQVADLYTKWNLNEKKLSDPKYDEAAARDNNAAQEQLIADISTGIGSSTSEYIPGQNGVRLITGYAMAGHPLKVALSNGVQPEDVSVDIIGMAGAVLYGAPLNNDCTVQLPASLRPGLYLVRFMHHGLTDTFKVVVKNTQRP